VTQWQTLAEEPAKAEEAEPEAKPARIRVYELAREMDVPSSELVEIMQEEGLEVTSHASSISAEEANVIRDLLLGGEATLEDLEAGAITIEL